MKNKQLLIFLSVYALLFILLFPAYRYVMDPDATGYLSVAEKIANGNYFHSVNGIWSPLGSWAIVPFIKAGCNGILAAKWLNGCYGLISLALYFSLLKKLKISFLPAMLTMGAAVLLLLHFAFARLFGDLLVVTILLGYLNIICRPDFGNFRTLIVAALIGTLAFYAKAYSFYFVLLHLPLAVIFSERKITGKFFNAAVAKKIFSALTVLLVLSSVWFAALHHKYGHFILGQKNVTGTLTERYHPLNNLVRPPATGNYAAFDDISNVNTTELTPFSSGRLFIIQAKLVAANLLQLLSAFNEFSVFFWTVILAGIILCRKRRTEELQKQPIFSLLLFTAVWTAGFLFFSIQSRFFWIVDLAVIAVAGILLTVCINAAMLLKKQFVIICTVIFGSFFIYPLVQLKNDFGRGKDLFDIAAALRKNNIRGNTLVGIESNEGYSNAVIVNYLAGSSFYGVYRYDFTAGEVLQAMKANSIKWFLYYYSTAASKESFLAGDISKSAVSVNQDIYPGIIVLGF